LIAEYPRLVCIDRVDVSPKSQLHVLWNRARVARPVGTEVIADCLRFLDETVLARPRASGTFGERPVELVAFRPTAAHPRAYKGTQDRRPTPPSPAPVVLSDVMLDLRAERAFLRHHSELVARLLTEDAWQSCARQLPVDCGGDAAVFDEGLFALTGFDGAALSPRFRALVWPQVRSLSAGQIGRLVALVRIAEQEASDDLVAQVAWWLATRADEDAVLWLEWAFSLAAQQRDIALAVLNSSGSSALTFSAAHVEWLPDVCAGGTPTGFASALRAMLVTLDAGFGPEYRRAGIELMHELDAHAGLHESSMTGDAPTETLRSIGHQLLLADTGPYSVIYAWDACGRAPVLGPAIAARDWAALEPPVAADLLWLLGAGLNLDGDGTLASAAWCASHAADIERAVGAIVPDRRVKFLEELHWLVASWPPEVLRRRGEAALRLAARLALAPFKSDARPVWVWNSVLEYASADQVEDIVGLPDRLWRTIDSGCTRRNQEYAITAGVDDLGRVLGPRMLAYVREAPAPLMKSARSAGIVSNASRAALLKTWEAAHRESAPRDALAALDKALAEAVLAPVGAIDRAGDDAVLHAALLRRSIWPNRRALGRFLRRYLAGDSDYLQTHPLTRRWLDGHPAVRLDRVGTIAPVVVDVPDLGIFTIAVETNPLEVLRLGTYVGSCLSLGGAYDYSAAAVALDVNKLVVYMRNHRGSVLARQLLAVSEQLELVRFDVYPASASDAAREQLMSFSEIVAAELGIPIHKPDHDDDDQECDIALVVATEWWDDGAA
jgi:hypothetical protein